MADETRNTEIEATDKPRPGNPNEPIRTPGQNPTDPSRGTPRDPDPDPSDPTRDRPHHDPDEEPRRDPSREDR
jgi:hypothetical protein